MTDQITVEPTWQSQLLSSEIGEDKETGTRFVFLKGLRRLSRLKGIKSEEHTFGSCFIWETVKKGAVPFSQVGYEVTYKDGTTYSDVADAHAYNIASPDFAVYTTAIAASRAEARALRKSLDIDLVSKEELGYTGAGYEMVEKIQPQQKKAIETLMKRKKFDSALEVLRKSGVSPDVTTLDSLTFSDATKVLTWLNNGD